MGVEGGDEKLFVGGIYCTDIVVESEESRRIDTRDGRRYSKIPARRGSHGRRRLELQDWRGQKQEIGKNERQSVSKKTRYER